MRKSKFSIFIFVTAIVSVAFIGVLFTLEAKTLFQEKLVEDDLNQEQVTAQEVGQFLEDMVRSNRVMLTVIAQVPEVRADDGKACSEKLQNLFSYTRTYLDNLARTGTDGKYYCSVVEGVSDPVGGILPVTDRILSDPAHSPVLSRVLLFNSGNSSRYLVTLHVPVRYYNGTFAGTLGGAMFLDNFEYRYIQQVEYIQRKHVMVIDDNGDIISYAVQPGLQGKNIFSEEAGARLGDIEPIRRLVRNISKISSGSLRYKNNGTEYLVGYSAVEVITDRYWLVVVANPANEASAQSGAIMFFEKFYQIYLLTNVFAVIIIIWVHLSLSKLIFTPLRMVTKTINEISMGNMGAEIDSQVRLRDDEIGDLAKAFERTLVSLKLAMKMTAPELRREADALKVEVDEEHEKTETLIGYLPQNIFFKDMNSVYLSCNENFATYLGIPAEQIRGKTDLDFYPKETAEKFLQDDKKVLETGQTLLLRENFILNGKEYYVQKVKAPLKDKKGAIIGIVGMFWDAPAE